MFFYTCRKWTPIYPPNVMYRSPILQIVTLHRVPFQMFMRLRDKKETYKGQKILFISSLVAHITHQLMFSANLIFKHPHQILFHPRNVSYEKAVAFLSRNAETQSRLSERKVSLPRDIRLTCARESRYD